MKKLYFIVFAFLFFFVANAQIINIPDANFKALLLSASPSNDIASTQTPDVKGKVNSFDTIDTNSDGEIQVSEASLIKYLEFMNGNIKSLEGINEFVNLQALNCGYNDLISLNISGLNNLQTLRCYKNQLTILDVTELTNLKILDCSDNLLMSLNVSGLSNLTILECQENQLTNLDVSGLNNLQELYCHY
ncbi:MAG TPA: hypothetical protein VN192_07470, partial [Flavobacterium sp.]|nr:hypothetical protein [Flavobacterium sp.]